MEIAKPIDKQRCRAMINADIADPNSRDGINFCVDHCPYDYCVVVEHRMTATQLKGKKKADLARKLRRHGVSVDDIALILAVTTRFVVRHLKK